MSKPIVALLVNDFRQQLRNGIYHAYGFVLTIYILILAFFKDNLPDWGVGLILYTDPVVLGFFFLGALMLLEKPEGTRSALAITPMGPAQYFWAKTLTLGSLSLSAVIILGLFLHAPNWPLYLFSAALIALTYTSISFPIALHFKTVTSYMMGAAGILTPIILPMFFALLDPVPLWSLFLPATAQFRLMLVALNAYSATGLELLIMLTVNILTASLSVYWGLNALKKEFGQS